jgi:hypothetical protein
MTSLLATSVRGKAQDTEIVSEGFSLLSVVQQLLVSWASTLLIYAAGH